MPFNPLASLVAALATLLVGFVWYNPKVFGTIWMNETGMTDEKAKQGNMLKIFGLTIFYSLMLSFMMIPSIVIHQFGAVQLVGGNEADASLVEFLKDKGDSFRSFQHGALHGVWAALFFVLPVTAINSLFELRSWKYILVTTGYWVVSFAIMGAIICGWK
jgi:hypothetical protein